MADKKTKKGTSTKSAKADAPKQFSLATAMNWLQDDLVRALTKGRDHLPHPGEVGDNAELHWIEMLRCFLPRRYSVGKAFIIDVNGNVSDQIDVVVYDQQYSPQIFRRDDTVYLPAESVYAVFEAKQELTKSYVEYAADKLASVRRLERTSAPVPHAGGTFTAKEPAQIIGGLLTLTSGWTPAIGKPFTKAVESRADEEHRLDLGCVANSGAFELHHHDDGIGIDVWKGQDGALTWFVTRLLARLHVVATVPAIDIVRWADAALKATRR
jgi:hypothetical protein